MIALCLLGAATSFCVALVLARVVLRLAARLGHVDRPGPGKRHSRPVPLGGGIAVFWAVAVPLGALALTPGAALRLGRSVPGAGLPGAFAGGADLLVLLAASLFLHLAGVWDDQRPLAPGPKLVLQMIAVAPLVLLWQEPLLPQWLPPAAGAVLAMLWLLAVTNAFNFLDGSDGLAATVGALCSALFVVPAILSGQPEEALLFSTLTGATVAFLLFNFPPARMFLGDGGSQVIGFLLAAGSLRLTYFDAGFRVESPWFAVFTPLAVLAIPLYDLVTVIAVRLAQRRSLFHRDDQHLLHRLARRGLGPRGLVAVVGASTVATGIGGVMLARLEAWQALLVVLQTGMVLVVLALLEIHLARAAVQSGSHPAEDLASAETPAPAAAGEAVPRASAIARGESTSAAVRNRG